MATTTAADPLIEEHERQIRELTRAAEAGEFDYIGREAVEYLASQLPEGYALDGEHRVVRTDPALPDHVDIRSLVFGKPGPLVRVPVYK